jgi:hypothetical protein
MSTRRPIIHFNFPFFTSATRKKKVFVYAKMNAGFFLFFYHQPNNNEKKNERMILRPF